MSEIIQVWSWRQAITKSKLASPTRHVLLTLSLHMNEHGGSCFPSMQRIADETGLSERSVRTHVQTARDAGWIKVLQHGFGDRRWKRNEYLPQFPKGFSLQAKGETSVPPAPDEVRQELPDDADLGAAGDSAPQAGGAANDDHEVRQELPPSSPIEQSIDDDHQEDEKLILDEEEEKAKQLVQRFYKIRQEVFDESPPERLLGVDVDEAKNWLKLPNATAERIEEIVRKRMRQIRSKHQKTPPCVKYLCQTVSEGLAKLPPLPAQQSTEPRRTEPNCCSEELAPRLAALKVSIEQFHKPGVWQSWFAPLSLMLSGHTTVVICPTKFHLQYMQQTYFDILQRHFETIELRVKT